MDSITQRLNQAIDNYRRHRGRSPHYVVLDARSFLECVGASYLQDPETLIDGLIQEARTGLGQVRIMGLIVVVIPTDGLPMLRVTGWPAGDAMDLMGEQHDQQQQNTE